MLRQNHFFIAFFQHIPHVIFIWLLWWLINGAFNRMFPNPSLISGGELVQFFINLIFYGCGLLSILSVTALIAGLFRKESFKEAYRTVISKQEQL